jgi:excisionase family DNA binding protein
MAHRDRKEREELLTVQEVADEIGVHAQTVRRWLRDGRIMGTLITRQAGYRIRRSEVDRLIEEGLREGKLAA